jgi:hypothetical protein
MGNRTGSPPEQYREDADEELPENQPEADDTQQTGIGDATQSERDDEETPSTDPDAADDTDETRGSGGGGGGVIGVPADSKPDDAPQEEAESDEEDQENEHPRAEGDSELESDSEERDDTEDDELDEFEFIYGDIVHDREAEPQEDEDPKELIVVNLPDDTIADWDCGDDETLADRNTGYPPTDSVVIVVTRDLLEKEMPEWNERAEEIALETLDVNGIDYNCYPSLRLELEEPSHLRAL